ncbi:MAG: phenylacetate--CoA ligase family protein [Candidatus Scalinduaceae bacterium]
MIVKAIRLRRLFQNRKLPLDDLKTLRNRKLRAVISHAYENVPYYRSLFNSAGLSPEDIRTVEDLRYVPITTKDDLKAVGVENSISKGTDVSSCLRVNTSGSTGKPFTVYLTQGEARIHRLIAFRTLISMGFQRRDRLAILGPIFPHRSRLFQHLGFYRIEHIMPFLSPEEQIKRLQRMSPTLLWAYPTVLKTLLRRVNYRLSKFVAPRALIYSAEVFDEVTKERIRADRYMEMFNFYGAIEAGRIAAECQAHEGLHVNADNVILECLNGDRPAKAGTPGSAVITTLNAFAMPLIRYRLGDICTFLEKTCSCGSSFPLIGPPIGRESDMIRLPSGKILSPFVFSHFLRNIGMITQFRIIQESYDKLVLQLAFHENPKQELLKKILSKCLMYLNESVILDIKIVDYIQEEKQKFRYFISKLPKSHF